jgi:hypothetical protein
VINRRVFLLPFSWTEGLPLPFSTLIARCYFYMLCVVLCVSTGCGGSDGIVLHRVSGTLVRGGKTVPDLMVHFDPVANGRGSSATSDIDGKFTLKYDAQRTGILPGEHKVWVQYLPSSPQEEMDIQTGKRQLPPETQAILSKYGLASTTPLREVIKGDQKDLQVKLD